MDWNGVSVWRCPIWVPSKPSGIKRLLHLASFAFTSLPIMLSQILWHPNIILTIEPPLFAAPAALLAARLYGAKAVLHIQDYEVDAAFDLALLKGDLLRKIVLQIEKTILRKFDLVSTISKRMIDKALGKGLDAQKIILFPNWADDTTNNLQMYSHQGGEFSYRKSLGIPEEAVIALYSGNMGAKQGLEILGELAKKVQKQDALAKLFTPIYFVFCGNGFARGDLELQCRGLHSVLFLDLQPVERLNEFLAMADIHLLPQRADAADLVMPSKLTGMLASGKPIIACAPKGSEVENIVRHCGVVVPPEDMDSFYAALLKLATDGELRCILGLAGLEYANKNLNRDSILSCFESKLAQISSR